MFDYYLFPSRKGNNQVIRLGIRQVAVMMGFSRRRGICMKKLIIISVVVVGILIYLFINPVNSENVDKKNGSKENEIMYTMPAEDLPHEGTWLIWPHRYTYGGGYQKEIEPIWIQMTIALSKHENVHIIAYNKTEQLRVGSLLKEKKVDMSKIDIVLAKSDDVWVRDTGPIFTFDKEDNLIITDFKFDGWGDKMPYSNDDQLSIKIGKKKNIPVQNLSDFVLEGGSVEIDGNGTLMATLSSVVSKNRNSNLTIKQAEKYLTKYLGVTNFIWLDGVTDEDITDAHIDGIARFIDKNTILTVSKNDFLDLYESINMEDYNKILDAKNVESEQYKVVTLPMTEKNVKGLDYKGSYLNYYIGNGVVLVPVYEDENDEIALTTIRKLYPNRTIIPIVVNSLYQYGGMIHCVTQQQPLVK